MSKKIIFTNLDELVYTDAHPPRPASEYLPEWYKKTQSFMGNRLDINSITNISSATIKKCIPVFDALTFGYIIVTPCDLIVKKDEGGNITYQTSIPNMIQGHSIQQAPYHPKMNHYPYPKWINTWGVETPSGYSCLFTAPLHGGNGFFTILDGVVDTDSYTATVNFPFVLNDSNFEGLIPAGTPMAQVIPFKRDDWKMELGSKNNLDNLLISNAKTATRYFNRYKSLFWHNKSYK
jgi:hypothetical protein